MKCFLRDVLPVLPMFTDFPKLSHIITLHYEMSLRIIFVSYRRNLFIQRRTLRKERLVPNTQLDGVRRKLKRAIGVLSEKG